MEESEYNEKVITLMDKLVRTESADKSQTNLLFELYNYRFTPRETKKDCGGCRARVFKRMKIYYEQIKGA